MFDDEFVFRIIELILTFIGLILVVFGWIVPYRQSVKEESKRKKFEEDLLKRQWKKELVDKQISEFYGPISALLNQKDILFSLVMFQLGRQYVFGRNQWKLSDLPQNEQLIWKHYVDEYLLPIQEEILDVISQNQHLIYNSEVPQCFESFQEYALGWKLLDSQKRNSVPNYYEYYYSYNYPKKFTTYINGTLKQLLKIQAQLINEIS